MQRLIKERQQHRLAIKNLLLLQEKVETSLNEGRILPTEISATLGQLSQTDSIDGQYQALSSFLVSMQDGYKELLRSNARDNLSCFVEYMNMDEPPAPHHEFLCDKLEAVARRETMRLMVSMPPGHAKSKFGSHYFPPWYLGRNPNHKFIQAGHSQEFVENEFGKRVRGIIDSEDFLAVFPDVKLAQGSRAAGALQLAGKLGRYLTRGVGQGISGYRANIAAVDDPYANRKDAESATIRKEVQDWLMADFTTRLLPRSPMYIIATRWNTLDICSVIEDMSKRGIGLPWEIINLPALAEENDPLGREEGEPLWPDYYDLDHLLNLRSTLPSRDWNSLYMGKPIDEDGGAVKSEWFQRYSIPPKDIVDAGGNIVKRSIKRRTLSVDTAAKEGQRNDFTAITIWFEDFEGKHYLIFVHKDRMQFEPMSAKINSLAEQFEVDQILVEDKGSGTQYIQVWQGKAPAPIIPITVTNDSKQFRFDGVTPMFEAGLVFFPTSANWLADYERELLLFPGAAHDDQVDSTSQYLAWARKGRQLGTTKFVHNSATEAKTPEIIGSGVSAVALHSSWRSRGRFTKVITATPSAKIGG